MSEELKPCPFCGGVANVEQLGHADSVFACCLRCATSSAVKESEDEAITAWNTRTPPAGMALVPLEPLKEVRRISDRKHEAWDAVNAAIEAAKEAT